MKNRQVTSAGLPGKRKATNEKEEDKQHQDVPNLAHKHGTELLNQHMTVIYLQGEVNMVGPSTSSLWQGSEEKGGGGP